MRTGQRFSKAQLEALGIKKRKSKYGNVPTFVGDQRLDSKKEARRLIALRLLERADAIFDLQCQVKFTFTINDQLFLTSSGRVFSYVADFCYFEDGKYVVEDVKSPSTAQNTVYRIKRDLMKHVHGIDIRET